MPESDLEEFLSQVQQTRAALERTHEGLLTLLSDRGLLRYEDVRQLVRSVDQQISTLQGSLITLRDTLAAFS